MNSSSSSLYQKFSSASSVPPYNASNKAASVWYLYGAVYKTPINPNVITLRISHPKNERKKRNALYRDRDQIPELVIKYYYSYAAKPEFTDIFTNFKEEYIDNEDRIENEIQNDFHSKIERKGLSKVYDYIHSYIPSNNLSIFLLVKLQQLLFSEAPYPEYAGNFRTNPVYLPGSGVDLTSYDMVAQEMANLLNESNKVIDQGLKLGRETNPIEKNKEIIDYIEKCVELNCKLIKIHPFQDGNGRTIRAFTNLMFKLANIPPVYIEYEEQEEYRKAMNKAIGEEQNLNDIKTFYLYKICDSIIKLDLGYSKRKNNKEKPLRKINNLLDIFHYGKSKANKNLSTKTMYKHEVILDMENEDYALYCEEQKTLSINLIDDKRMFVMKQIETKTLPRIEFLIDDEIVDCMKFEEELNKKPHINNQQLSQNVYRIKRHI